MIRQTPRRTPMQSRILLAYSHALMLGVPSNLILAFFPRRFPRVDILSPFPAPHSRRVRGRGRDYQKARRDRGEPSYADLAYGGETRG